MAMTVKDPRWRRRKEARPAEIVAAALTCFAERGFAATRLEAIAQRAGVTKGTLYLYFESKEALFEAMVRQSIVPLLASREEMIEHSTASNTELLTALLMSFPEAIIDQPITAIPKIVLSEAGNFPALAKFYNEEVIGRGRRLVRKLVERGIARGEFRPVDLDHVFFSVMAPVVKVGDKVFNAGGQEFLLISGTDGKVKYMHIAAHALRKM